MQVGGSFKARGMFNRMLAQPLPAAGVVVASGGNAGIAVAYSGRQLGLPVLVVVPETTSERAKALMHQHRLERVLVVNDAMELRGLITVKDILAELEKPGRDPRPDFKVARFNDGVEDIKDLKEGMILEGTVSNVAAFGAFIDLGVHQDGLVHVSQLAHKFVNDAREVVKTGDIVKVRVVEVDLARKRIALTMKLDAPAPRPGERRDDQGFRAPARAERTQLRKEAPASSAMAAAFAKLQPRK